MAKCFGAIHCITWFFHFRLTHGVVDVACTITIAVTPPVLRSIVKYHQESRWRDDTKNALVTFLTASPH